MRKKFLLDTHVLIWLINNESENLKGKKFDFLRSFCFVSIESLKELALKSALGKIEIETNPKRLLKEISDLNITVLDFDKQAVSALFNLPFNENHKDPFDRSIIAHAISQKMVLVSTDEKFPFYQKHGLRLQRL